jgi:hypothetical protein
VKKRQLDHVLRAAGKIAGDSEFIIVGSQALHGAYPDVADQLMVSVEVDLFAKNHPDDTENLNAIGVDSPFHEQFGYYADPVDRRTAVLPRGWERRLVALPAGDTDGVTGWCLEPHDLAIAKYVAGRDKDREFVKGLASRKLVEQDTLLELLDATPIPTGVRNRLRTAIKADFSSSRKAAK